jgi:hexosaminidase
VDHGLRPPIEKKALPATDRIATIQKLCIRFPVSRDRLAPIRWSIKERVSFATGAFMIRRHCSVPPFTWGAVRRSLLAFALALLPFAAQNCLGQSDSSSFRNTLLPQPSSLRVEQGEYFFTPAFSAATDKFHDSRLDQAIRRAVKRLADATGLQLSAEPASGSPAALVVSVDGPGEPVQSVDANESYSLTVTQQSVHLSAATDVGAIRGFATLVQLVQNDGKQYFLPAITINDSPRFHWRGLMIDCSRHFEPVSVIERTLDGMEAVKLNVFHWHLSDDQGFRIQSKVFPLLTQLGSDGQFYTQAQAREVVAYARARGIRVVPEFDMPGHTTSWFVGYPQLASAAGPFQIQTGFGVFDPVMDPTRDSTYRFLDKFIGEMAAIFPDQYMHIGGDENNGVEWSQNQRIQAFMHAHHMTTTPELQAYFNQRLQKILKKHGKRMIGWDEVLTPDLPKSVAVQSWRGFNSLANAAREGHEGILSAGYYLDHIMPASAYYRVDPVPADSTLSAADRARILGGEACMWGEYVDPRIIDSRIWPRAAAIAERLWSPQSVNDVDDMYRRLNVESLRLEALGLTQISQEDASLRTLAGTRAIDPLRVLAPTIEPVDFPVRGAYSHEHQVTNQMPLDHLVDALPPDPPFRHNFQLLVDAYLKSRREQSPEAAQLRSLFEQWIAAQPGVLHLMAVSPLLAQAQTRPAQLAQLGSIGLESLTYISSGQAAPAGWRAAQLSAIEASAAPVALTRFDILRPLRNLVNAVQEAGAP